ncbi:MAG: HAMP domain-containing histidine kinase [Eubacterium sp.]|nr:HAMP domain-containing histidine kinase [Eubacterium sp.]MCI8917240.1 HAMP domain-containing histidine kinase [Eubacterium sp.]
MRNASVKIKITVWLTLLMALLAIFLIVFMLSISSTVVSQTAMSQLAYTVQSNLGQVNVKNGRPEFGDGFRFYQNGISTLVYSQKEALLAGQIPGAFTADEPFQNGVIRTVSTDEDKYLVMDLWLPMGWDHGVWIRGLMETPDNHWAALNLLKVALVALPVFMALAALGSYWIARRAFRPLDSINATAEAINEAKDLSRRIGLPKGRDEFSRLGSTFDQLFERLEQSFEVEKQFISDASHELRTPVSIIKGACEYAEKYDETSEDHQETISMIHRQAAKMSGIISQLLSMTRLDQGTELSGMEPVDLAELLRDFSREQENNQTYDYSRLTLELKEEAVVWGNQVLLTRLIQNLVENAFKYGRPNGHVWAVLDKNGSEVRLKVRDDGFGIDKEHQDKIWQRFYQVDPARSGEMGAGLGLPMVAQIARVHGGYMTLDSAPDLGSVFTLHLNIYNEDAVSGEK